MRVVIQEWANDLLRVELAHFQAHMPAECLRVGLTGGEYVSDDALYKKVDSHQEVSKVRLLEIGEGRHD